MTGAWGLHRLGPAPLAVAAAPVGAFAILVAYKTNPVVPLAALIALGVVALAVVRPLWSLLLAFACIPLEGITLPLGVLSLSASEATFILTAAAWSLGRLAAGRRPWPDTPLAGPLALLWLSTLPALAVATDVAGLIRLSIFWGAFLLLFALVATDGDAGYVRTLLFVLALVGAVVGAVATVSSGGEQPELSALGDTATGRAVGAFGDPNILGTFLAMTLPAAVLVAFEGRWRRGPLAFTAGALILAGLGLSLSRGGILAAAGALLVLLAWTPVRRVALVLVVLLLGVTLLNANPLGDVQQVQLVVNRLESVRNESSSNADQRSLVYTETPRLIADHWLTGVGALNYPLISPRYGIVDPVTGLSFEHAHNVVLTIGAEEGILGLIALAWLIVAALRTMRRVCSRSVGAGRGLGLAVTGALVALGLQGVVDYTLRSNIIAALAFVLLGALAVLGREAREDAEAAASGGGSPASPPAAPGPRWNGRAADRGRAASGRRPGGRRSPSPWTA